MSEIKFTPIHNGRMIMEKEIRNEKAIAYSRHIRRKRAKSIENVMLGLGMTVGIMALFATFNGNMEARAMEPVEEVQEYEVRYGTTYLSGSAILTEEGNMWTLKDAAKFSDGTKVRVVFGTCKTESIKDDFIIDITER